MKPIIFSAEMVKAILEGRKRVTRRVVKPQFPVGLPDGKYRYDGVQEGIHGIELLDADANPTEKYFSCGKPPYQPGDVLWVRESWTLMEPKNNEGPPFYLYKADEPDCEGSPWFSKWRSSMFMPRAAARIYLRVTDVRVERLQEISEADAKAEGIRSFWLTKEGGEGADDWHESNGTFVGTINHLSPFHSTRCEAYQQLWDSLNAKRGFGWKDNPWVWVITFERVEV